MRLETARLVLRPWQERDRAPLAAILGDPEVRRFFPAVATPAEANAQIDRAIAQTAARGFHFAAAELKATGKLIGIIGLGVIDDETRAAIPGHPEIEVGWQLDRAVWGHGLAPEGAGAWLAYGWKSLAVPEIVAITATVNAPSRRVMEKLGMHHDAAADFDHPRLPASHPLRRHVLYRVSRPAQR